MTKHHAAKTAYRPDLTAESRSRVSTFLTLDSPPDETNLVAVGLSPELPVGSGETSGEQWEGRCSIERSLSPWASWRRVLKRRYAMNFRPMRRLRSLL